MLLRASALARPAGSPAHVRARSAGDGGMILAEIGAPARWHPAPTMDRLKELRAVANPRGRVIQHLRKQAEDSAEVREEPRCKKRRRVRSILNAERHGEIYCRAVQEAERSPHERVRHRQRWRTRSVCIQR